jgi:hypothetical protein
VPTDGTRFRMDFMPVPEPKVGPNRLHLDLTSTSPVNTNERGYQPPLPVGTTTFSQLEPTPNCRCSTPRDGSLGSVSRVQAVRALGNSGVQRAIAFAPTDRGCNHSALPVHSPSQFSKTRTESGVGGAWTEIHVQARDPRSFCRYTYRSASVSWAARLPELISTVSGGSSPSHAARPNAPTTTAIGANHPNDLILWVDIVSLAFSEARHAMRRL